MCITDLMEFLIVALSGGPQDFLYAGAATQMLLRTKEVIAAQKF